MPRLYTPDYLGAAHHRTEPSNCLRRQVPTRHMPCVGLLFDCDEHGGAVAGRINLREAEPMQMAGLWSCIYDAMHCNREISSILTPIGSSKVSLLNADCISELLVTLSRLLVNMSQLLVHAGDHVLSTNSLYASPLSAPAHV